LIFLSQYTTCCEKSDVFNRLIRLLRISITKLASFANTLINFLKNVDISQLWADFLVSHQLGNRSAIEKHVVYLETSICIAKHPYTSPNLCYVCYNYQLWNM